MLCCVHCVLTELVDNEITYKVLNLNTMLVDTPSKSNMEEYIRIVDSTLNVEG